MPPTILIILKDTQKKDRPIYFTAERENICLLVICSLCIFANNIEWQLKYAVKKQIHVVRIFRLKMQWNTFDHCVLVH